MTLIIADRVHAARRRFRSANLGAGEVSERGGKRTVGASWVESLRAAVVERVLEAPEEDAEHCAADRCLAEGSAIGSGLRNQLRSPF
jgi:hypothetical protein